MKFRLLFLLIGLIYLTGCSQDKNSTFKGAYSLAGRSSLFVSCDGVPMNIRPVGESYKKMKNRYLAFEMDEKPVMVSLKAKVIERIKVKNGLELLEIEVTSFLDMEIGINCAGETINY